MILRTALFFIIFSIVRGSTVFKNGNEYLYKYTVMTKTGTDEPAEFYSYSQIKADLHVKSVNDNLLIWLDNVNYVTYTGSAEDDIEGATKEVPIPDESKSLLLPFVYSRYSDETKNGITTSPEDEPWSKNIKQALTSLLYVNKIGLKLSPQTYHYKEDELLYIMTTNEEKIQIIGTNIVEQDIENNVQPLIKRFYHLSKKNDEYTLDSVSSHSKYGHSILKENGDTFYARMGQSLELNEVKVVDDSSLDIENMVYTPVNKHPVIEMNSKNTGTNTVEESDEIKSLVNDLETTLERLENVHPRIPTLWSDDDQDALNKLFLRFRFLDVTKLNKLYALVSENKDLTSLLIQITLLTGSHEGYCFGVDLIEKDVLNQNDILNILEKMATYPITLTECVEKGLFNLIDNKETKFKKLVEHQAIITMASMVRETTKNTGTGNKDFVKTLVENLKNSKDKTDQSTYVYALLNVDSYETRVELVNIAQGKNKDYNHLPVHIRALAVDCMKVVSNSEHLLQILLGDHNEHFEVRAAALNALFNTKRPLDFVKSMALLTKDDDALYHLLYTRLESVSNLDSSEKNNDAFRAKILLRNLMVPKRTEKSLSKVYEFSDESHGFKITFENTNYGKMVENNFVSYHIKLKTESVYSEWNSYELYVHLTNGRREETLLDILNSLNNMKVEREMILKHNGYVVSVEAIDLKRMIVDVFNGKFSRDTLRGMMIRNVVTTIPTDMGTSVSFVNRKFCLNKNYLEAFIHVNESLGRLAFNGRHKCVHSYGVAIYNPIMNIWNGVNKTCNVEANLPIDAKVEVEYDVEAKGKLTLRRGSRPFGVQTFRATKVIVIDKEGGGRLKASCPTCEEQTTVTSDRNNQDHNVILEGYNENVGLEYKIATYGCEEDLVSTTPKNCIQNLMKLSTLLSSNEMCGVSLIVGSKKEHPKTQVELVYTLYNSYSSTSDELQALTVDNIKLESTIKNEDKILNTWVFTYECMSYVQNSTSCDLKFISKKENEPDNGICLDINTSFKPFDVQTSFLYFSGEIENGTCSDESSKVIVQFTSTNAEEFDSVTDLERVLKKCDSDKKKSFDDCLMEVSAYRVSYFNVTYSNLKQEHKAMWARLSDLFREKYGKQFYRIDKYDNTENFIDIKVTYPENSDSIDVSVIAPHETYGYKGLKFQDILWKLFLNPYSGLRVDDDRRGNYCEAGLDYIQVYSDDPEDQIKFRYKNEGWTSLATNCNDEGVCEWRIRAKKSDDESKTFVLRVEIGGDVVEVAHKEGFETKLNGELVELKQNAMTRISKIFDVLVVSSHGVVKRVILHSIPNMVNVEYTPSRIRMSVPGGVCP